jgi:hypothetical protein
MAAPALIHRFDIRVNLAAPIELGQTPHGLKRIVPVAGGVVDGPYMRGDVLPGGADWQTVRADGITEIDVRCTLCTHDGVLIAVYSQGYRHAPPEIIQKILKGEAVPDDSYLFPHRAALRVGWRSVSSVEPCSVHRRRIAAARPCSVACL